MTRRNLITGGVVAGVGALGAHRAAAHYGLIAPDARGILGAGEALTYASHRLLVGNARAREFPRHKISAAPFANGRPPQDAFFQRHVASGFADWRLDVGGLVTRPRSFTIGELRDLPRSSQITQLVCEEGWSYIAEWIGTPLSHVLRAVEIMPQARFIVYSTPQLKRRPLWDSLDIAEAMHPQTLVAFGMNGGELPVGFGGPLRLRVPRQLGYKSVKYLATITVTDDITKFGKGLGSLEAEMGYSWYAGM